MARLASEIPFTGPLGSLSAYRMRGVDGIILRRKGGASKQRIKTAPSFENTRRLNAEFSGRARAVHWMLRMLHPLKALADHNIAGPLNGLMRPVQLLDTESEFGKRHILLSQDHRMPEGFSLNRKVLFESLIQAPLSGTISRETLSAQVDIPVLLPGINFRPAAKHPLYSLQASLGVIPDLFWTATGYRPSHQDYDHMKPVTAETSWFMTAAGSDATTLGLKLDSIPPDEAFTLMLTIGIRFGMPSAMGHTEQVKYAGSAKIWRLA